VSARGTSQKLYASRLSARIGAGDETKLNPPRFDSKQRIPSENSSRPTEAPATGETNATGADDPLSGPACSEESGPSYNPRFIEFFRLLAEIHATDSTANLFPKRCRVCTKEFQGMSEYLCGTTPKGHVFEDCKDVMKKPFTMVYRHCTCGNTLVLTLTDKNFQALDRMWSMLADEAAASSLPLESVVREFSRQCDRFVLREDDSCDQRVRP
jgi:hypothetical protein